MSGSNLGKAMMSHGRGLLRLSVGAGTAALAACAAAVPPPDAGDQALAAVRSLIGDAACRDDTQCRTLPVGRLACGGPAAFLAWSTVRSNETDLTAAAAPLAQRRPGSGAGDLSVCRVLPDPGARCVVPPGASVGECRLRSRSDGPGAPLPVR